MPLEKYLRKVGGELFVSSYKALKFYSKFHGFDITKPCSMHDDDGRCWIFNHLRQINYLLFHTSMGLKETTPGRLSLCDLDVDDIVDKPLIIVGCILAHLILRIHECISSACFSTVVMDSTSDQSILGDALRYNKGLRSIEVIENKLGRQKKFMKALCGMNNIESLSLIGVKVPRNLVTDFAVMIARQPLRSIALVGPGICNDEVLVAICRNFEKLKKLVYKEIIFKEGKMALNELLSKETCVLEELQLISAVDTELDGLKFVQGLACNKTLKSLQLNLCTLTPRVTAALAEILKMNVGVLETLDIGFTLLDDASATHLAKAIEYNTSLKVLKVLANDFTSQGYSLLFQSLCQNKTLKMLDMGLPHEMNLEEIDNLNLHDRVCTTYSSANIRAMCETLTVRSNEITSFSVEIADVEYDQAVLEELFRLLSELPRLESLSITVEISLTEPIAHMLGNLIRKTKVLKTVKLDTLHPESDVVVMVLNALAENKTVTSFDWDKVPLFKTECVEAFINLLTENSTLIEMGTCYGDFVALSTIILKLKNNVIRTIKMKTVNPNTALPLFNLQDMLRTNWTNLCRTVDFVKDHSVLTESPHLSKIVDELLHSNSFREFFNCVENENNFDAMFNCAKTYLAENFFSLTGVCGGETSLQDQIPLTYDAWQHVCSYMRLDDVK